MLLPLQSDLEPLTLVLRTDQRADLFAEHNPADIAALVQVENDDGQIVVLAQGDGGRVHHVEALLQNIHVGKLRKLLGILHFHRVGVVDAVHFGGFEDGIGFDFHGAQRGGGIGREIRVAGASGKDDDASFFKMPDGAAPDEGLGYLVHLYGCLHAGEDVLFFESVLQRKRVDDGGQHAHVVGGDAIHVLGLLGNATEKIAATYDNRHLDTETVYIGEFSRDFMNASGVDAEALSGGKGFAGDFQQDALEDRCRHEELV